MSELEEADLAVNARLESVDFSADVDPWALLFIGMDLDSDETWRLAGEHADAAIAELAQALLKTNSPLERHVIAHGYFRSAWLDGFSVAAMLFLRRKEQGR